jgi:multidrug resistance efflux pump
LVEANLVIAKAPAAARVAEVFVAPGQTVLAGAPLLRLEALETSARQVRAAEVEQRRLRLALASAGGAVDGMDLRRRFDLVAEAEIELAAADAKIATNEAGIEVLQRQLDAVTLEVTRQEERLDGQLSSMTEQLRGAHAAQDSAQEQLVLASAGKQMRDQLEASGVASTWQALQATTIRDRASLGLEQLDAVRRALEIDIESTRRLKELGDTHGSARRSEVEARIEAARRRLETASGRIRRR